MTATWDCCLHRCRLVQLVLMYSDKFDPTFTMIKYENRIRFDQEREKNKHTNEQTNFSSTFYHDLLNFFLTYKKWIWNRCDWTDVGIFGGNSIFRFHCDEFLMMILNNILIFKRKWYVIDKTKIKTEKMERTMIIWHMDLYGTKLQQQQQQRHIKC